MPEPHLQPPNRPHSLGCRVRFISQDGDGLCPCQYHPTHASYARIATIFAAAIKRKFP